MSKTKSDWNFAMRVRGVTPASIPMARLAEYMREFAELLGSRQTVHFAGIIRGSVVLRARVDEQSTTDTSIRVLGVKRGDAPKEAIERVAKIDRLMREDGARGEIIRQDGNVIYAFEGARRATDVQPEITISQDGELIGTVMRIGGRDDTVPLLLGDADGKFYDANIKGRELARQMAAHLFGQPVRAVGNGTWTRCADGEWKLDRFLVTAFEVLDDRPALDVINEIRVLQNNGWASLDDPVGEWLRLREGD